MIKCSYGGQRSIVTMFLRLLFVFFTGVTIMLITSTEAEPCYIGQVIDPANIDDIRWGVAFDTSVCECTEISVGGGVSVVDSSVVQDSFWFHDDLFSLTDPSKGRVWRQNCEPLTGDGEKGDTGNGETGGVDGGESMITPGGVEHTPGDVEATPTSGIIEKGVGNSETAATDKSASDGGVFGGGNEVTTVSATTANDAGGLFGGGNEATTVSHTTTNDATTNAFVYTCEIYWHVFGSNCYRANNVTSKTFNEAETACLNKPGHLASIQSEEENTFINETFTGELWIGFTNQIANNTFSWTDGNQGIYTSWRHGEPNRNMPGEDCAVWVSDGWRDRACSDTNGYICKKAAAQSIPTTAVNANGRVDA